MQANQPRQFVTARLRPQAYTIVYLKSAGSRAGPNNSTQ